MREYLRFYVDGRWVEPIELKTMSVENPATEQICGRIALGSARELAEFLSLSVDVGVVSETVGRPLVNDNERVIQLLVGLLKHLGTKSKRS